jgi:uncharacterized protein YyaL (SSP411 family)
MSATNRLANETSPYLLQHSRNPVDWYPWGPEALARARDEDKPIFLSIGYAACHWCHVMERESFENERIAEFLNQHFVAIKVDREERPDIDDIYMAATVAISGSGGWPMSVFLAPDQRPFFAGTYYPPNDRWGRPGFLALLTRIAELWRSERESLLGQAKELTEHIRKNSAGSRVGSVQKEHLERAVADFSASFDERWGGFGTAPKFPPHQGLRLLLRAFRDSGDAKIEKMITTTLDGMKNGGIYDHVAGGFARYSTDERWLVPHFEKMLYDNAQLALVYLEAFQVTANPEYRRVAAETLDYVLREMQDSAGGYYSATDADSEGDEGKFFVFLPEEIDDILGKDEAEAFCLYYDITVGGNWEGKNVLNTPSSLERVASELGKDPVTLAAELQRSREKVYAARKERVPPLLDDKILAAWNGLMIEAMAEGHRVLQEERYRDSAERAARFVVEKLARPDGGLYRTARGGKAHIAAFLEDYAYVSDALITLYEATGERRWLDDARRLAARIVSDFSADDAGFFQTASDHETLISRSREGHDGALPNANAVAARALARLGYHLDDRTLLERAEAALASFGAFVARAPRAFASALLTARWLFERPTELVLVGSPGSAEREALARAVAAEFVPERVRTLVDPRTPSELPAARDKGLVDGRAALYVCRHFSCQAPVIEPAGVAPALSADRAGREARPSLGGG